MSFAHWLTVAVLATLPFAAAAQAQPDPSDPNAPFRAPAYQSAFTGYQSTADEQATPDKVWRAANDQVGKLGGHAGHIGHAGHTMGDPAPSAAPSPSQQMPAHHGQHHHGSIAR